MTPTDRAVNASTFESWMYMCKHTVSAPYAGHKSRCVFSHRSGQPAPGTTRPAREATWCAPRP